MPAADGLDPAAKLVRVVLETCGPLSPREVAEEAYLSEAGAVAAMAELERHGIAEPVCGVCESREEVYGLVDGPRRAEPSA